MIDHVIIKVKDQQASRGFYEKALAPLGYRVLMELPKGVAFGVERPELGLSEESPPTQPLHLAFGSPDRATVDAFHKAALAAGGIDNGPPGLRKLYHSDYYGAFVLDPDGHNIEAVCHRPEG